MNPSNPGRPRLARSRAGDSAGSIASNGGLPDMNFSKIGVVGAGNIGTGVITDLVLHGLHAVVVDISDGAPQGRIRGFEERPLRSDVCENARVSPDEARQRMTFSRVLKDLADCEMIIENVPEDWNLKRPIYRELDAILPPEVCIGANTSCLSITKIAAATNQARAGCRHSFHEPGAPQADGRGHPRFSHFRQHARPPASAPRPTAKTGDRRR